MPPLLSEKISSPEEIAAEKYKNFIVEWQGNLFNKAVAYTNLIVAGGYAGAFALWSYTKTSLSPQATATVGLLLVISLVFFVSFEVFKMVWYTIHTSEYLANLRGTQSAQNLLDGLKKLEFEESHRNIKIMFPVWRVTVAITALTALMAMFLLLYNFTAILTKLPAWP